MSKSINDGSTGTTAGELDLVISGSMEMKFKIVSFEEWKYWQEAKEYVGICKSEHNMKAMSELEEQRRALSYAINKEMEDGWILQTTMDPIGFVFAKMCEKSSAPSLESLFAADPTNPEWLKRIKAFDEDHEDSG